MEKIKVFLNDFIKAEETAHSEYRKEDNIEVYNQAVDNLDSYTYLVSENYPDIGFNLRKMTEPHDEDFFEEVPLMEEILPRHIFKISHYENNTYGNLWACYVSISNPINNRKRIHNCFIVSEINSELKIISKFVKDSDTNKWINIAGDQELKPYNLGKILDIDLLMEPVDDAWSMEQYNKEI